MLAVNAKYDGMVLYRFHSYLLVNKRGNAKETASSTYINKNRFCNTKQKLNLDEFPIKKISYKEFPLTLLVTWKFQTSYENKH